MYTGSYDYSFSPNPGQKADFFWEYAQQRNTMGTQLDDIEKDLLEYSSKGQLYLFTKTINTLPSEQAALVNRKVLDRVVKNIRNLAVIPDAKVSALNVYTHKFGH